MEEQRKEVNKATTEDKEEDSSLLDEKSDNSQDGQQKLDNQKIQIKADDSKEKSEDDIEEVQIEVSNSSEKSNTSSHHEKKRNTEPSGPFLEKVTKFFDINYKKMLIIPIALLILSIILISYKGITTGEIIDKDVSLKGGITVTIMGDQNIDIIKLQESLAAEFLGNEIGVRSLQKGATISGIIITSDIDGTKKGELELFMASIENNLGRKLLEKDYSIEVIGSALGASFFKEIVRALIIAFIFMGIVVLIYFRVLVPSLIVILAAFSDIIVTLAIINLMGLKINTAGIAAFLMLIGYSVDTDILLSTKVLKKSEGRTVFESIINAMKTGLMMTFTTICAIVVALIFTQSEIIRQIMIILLVGLIVDLINTWLGNGALLRLYVERKKK
ncbi:MAG: hypothetical protein ABIC04_08530 [Nanoarchaeota archaeon]